MLKDSKGSLYQIFDYVPAFSVLHLQVVSRRFYVILQEYLSWITVLQTQEILLVKPLAS